MALIDGVTGLMLQVKRVSEDVVYDFDFSELLNSGDNIASVASVSQARRGIVTGSVDMTIGNPLHDSAKLAQVMLSGGTDGEYYCLDLVVQTVSGESRQCSGVVYVKEVC